MTHLRSMLFPLLLVLYEIATYLSNDMYLPGLPQMRQDLSLSTQQAQLTLTMWFMGSASMPLLMGAISDHYGRRSVLLWSGLIYIVATTLCAMAGSETMLLMMRFVQGGMTATMMVSGYAAIHELYEHTEAIHMLALMGSISVLAPALGPFCGALILLFMSWRGIFWTIVILASVAIGLLYYWMPETLPQEKRQSFHWNSLLRRYRGILCNINFMLLMLVEGFIFCGFLSWITSGPLLIIETFHCSAITYGIMQAFVFGAYILGNAFVKKKLATWGSDFLIHLGLGIAFLGGVLMLGFAYLQPLGLYTFLVAMIIYSMGSGLCFSPLNRSIIETSDEAMGARVAMFTVFLTSFAALGSAFSSLFFSGSLLSLAWIISIPAALACFFKWISSLINDT